MTLKANSHSQNKCKQALLIASTCLGLTYLSAQSLAVQTLPNSITISQNIKQSKTVPYNRLVIGGVDLSMSEAQVRKALGKPFKTKNGYEAIAGKTRILQYSGMTIKLLEDVEPTGKYFVYEIEATSSKYTTVDGVKVGDRVLRVIKIYGKPQSSDSHSLIYEVDNSSPTYFNFTIQNGRVRKIICGDFLG